MPRTDRARFVEEDTGAAITTWAPLKHVGAVTDTLVMVKRPHDISQADGLERAFFRAVDRTVHGPRDLRFQHRATRSQGE